MENKKESEPQVQVDQEKKAEVSFELAKDEAELLEDFGVLTAAEYTCALM